MGREIFIIAVLLTSVASEAIPGVNTLCRSQFRWVPIARKYLAMEILNEFSVPTWTSSRRNQLVLPRNVPFAFGCGACYSSWVTPTISLSIAGAKHTVFEPVYDCSKNIQRELSQDTDCVLSYGLTEVEKPGFIACILNRRNKLTTRNVTFGTVDVPIETSPDVIPSINEDGFANVTCPDVPLPRKNLIYVWHYPDYTRGVVKTTMKSSTFLPAKKQPYTVQCTVYDTKNPQKVWRQTFHIEKVPENVTSLFYQEKRREPLSFMEILMIIGGIVLGLLLISMFAIAIQDRRKRKQSNNLLKKPLTSQPPK